MSSRKPQPTQKSWDFLKQPDAVPNPNVPNALPPGSLPPGSLPVPTAPVPVKPVSVKPVGIKPVPVTPVAVPAAIPGMPPAARPVSPNPPGPLMPPGPMPRPVAVPPNAAAPVRAPAVPIQAAAVPQVATPPNRPNPPAPIVRPVPVVRPAVQPTVRPVVQPVARAPTPQAASPMTRTVDVLHPIQLDVRSVKVEAPEPAEHDLTEEVAETVTRSAPPYLISFCVHLGALMILALMYVPQLFNKTQVAIQAIYADEIGEQLLDATLQSPLSDLKDLETPQLSFDVAPAEDPFAAPPELKLDALAKSVSSDVVAPSIGLALSGREKGAKESLLAAYGGTALTEDAVGLALEWLKRNQTTKGTWSLTGPYENGGGVENETAATALAMLAFQGAGNTHQAGRYKVEMGKAMKALLKMQDPDGNFFRVGPDHHRLYSQGIATIAICELYGMSKDPALRGPAQKAIDYAARIQADDGQGGGGWRYVPKRDVDTSVTGWFVMAMQSGRMAGLEVQSPVLDKVSQYLDNASIEGGTQYKYRLNEGPSLTMTAEAMLCRQYLGWSHGDPRLRTGVDLISAVPMDWNDPNTYYWYYATQVLHHMGGDDWFKWNNVMREVLPKNQTKNGREKGSWDPSNDRWATHGGRLYMTCLCTFMLEVYYRHLPLYKHSP